MIWVPEAGLFPMTPRPVSAFEAAQYLFREALGICRKRGIEHEAHHLPVSCEGGLCR